MALRTGTRFAVRSAEVFPQGCVFIPGSISEVQDFDENTRARTPNTAVAVTSAVTAANTENSGGS